MHALVCAKPESSETAPIKYLSEIAICIINIHKIGLLFFRAENITFCNYATVKVKQGIQSFAGYSVSVLQE